MPDPTLPPTCATCSHLAAELERLRAQVAALRGQDFSREEPPAAAGPVPSLTVGYPRSALAQDGRRLHAEPSAPAFVRVA